MRCPVLSDWVKIRSGLGYVSQKCLHMLFVYFYKFTCQRYIRSNTTRTQVLQTPRKTGPLSTRLATGGLCTSLGRIEAPLVSPPPGSS